MSQSNRYATAENPLLFHEVPLLVVKFGLWCAVCGYAYWVVVWCAVCGYVYWVGVLCVAMFIGRLFFPLQL
jgi:hypothetical protein